MKVIDLLNKIANGEELPKKINYKGLFFEYDENREDYKCNYNNKNSGFIYSFILDGKRLNNEVKIIEEDKRIGKLELQFLNKEKLTDDEIIIWFKSIAIMLNQISDVLNESKGKSE